MDTVKRPEKEREFIVGIIANKKKVEGFAIYNMTTKEGKIESSRKVMERFKNGESIAGLVASESINYSNEEFVCKTYPHLSAGLYNTNRLPKLNGAGEVIQDGLDIAIELGNENGKSKYLIVNSQFQAKEVEESYLKDKEFVGARRYRDSQRFSKECKAQ